MSEEEKTPSDRARSHDFTCHPDTNNNNSGEDDEMHTVVRGDNNNSSSRSDDTPSDVENDLASEGCVKEVEQCSEEEERTVAWLSLRKQAAESRCRELEKELAEVKEAATKKDTSVHVAHEKIRLLEAESKALIAAAEFREKEASSMHEGASLAQERAHAHEKALASALEQLSDSGVSQSKKLAELADVTGELKRTKAALERAERLVFEQRQEADERQNDENRRRRETVVLRDNLAKAERKNTELLTKQAAGRLAKKMRGNFGRSSTFCASFCSCFRARPAYRRVASPTPFAAPPPPTTLDSPWLDDTVRQS